MNLDTNGNETREDGTYWKQWLCASVSHVYKLGSQTFSSLTSLLKTSSTQAWIFLNGTHLILKWHQTQNEIPLADARKYFGIWWFWKKPAGFLTSHRRNFLWDQMHTAEFKLPFEILIEHHKKTNLLLMHFFTLFKVRN